MKRHIYNNEQELIAAFANYFIEQANYFINNSGQFNVALAGGSSPKRVYELLASSEYRNKTEWEKIYFFFGDERYVPVNDPQYNGLMVEQALFNPLHISSDHVFKIDTSYPPREAARKYAETIAAHFNKKPIQFDLILLGLGDNSHTASLFPFTEILPAKSASVNAVYLTEENVYRISMTAPMINQAKNIAFLVFGEKKAEAVQAVINGEYDPEQFPAQLIKPINGNLHWFLDEKAAGMLT
jgi:6-phosphogluconolactonase